MKKNIFILLATLWMSTYTYGQQNPQYTQYLQNPFVINPAMTGLEDYLDITAAHRNQWTGFEGAPRTFTFSANTPLDFLKGQLTNGRERKRIGLGLFLTSDQTGPINRSSFYGSYAYHLKLDKTWYISFGTFIGATQFRFDENEAVLVQDSNDILVRDFSNMQFDMSVGIYLYSDFIFGGVSVNQIFDREIVLDLQNSSFEPTGKINRNFNFLLGSRIKAGRDSEVVPSLLVKYVDPSPVQWELGAKYVYDNRFWGGLAYRNEESVIALAGLRFLDNFLFSYSYDFVFEDDLSAGQSGSHELLLSYRFFFGNSNCRCPRFSN